MKPTNNHEDLAFFLGLPIALLFSLLICGILYLAFAS